MFAPMRPSPIMPVCIVVLCLVLVNLYLSNPDVRPFHAGRDTFQGFR